jgi:hypothetical protein
VGDLIAESSPMLEGIALVVLRTRMRSLGGNSLAQLRPAATFSGKLMNQDRHRPDRDA